MDSAAGNVIRADTDGDSAFRAGTNEAQFGPIRVRQGP